MRWIRARPSASSRVPGRAVAIAAAAVVIVAGCGSAPGSPSRSAPQRSGHPGTPVPSVDEAAFAGHGELAFVSRGGLWVLDGATGTLRRVPTPAMTPLDPAFSRDGRWLSFPCSPYWPCQDGEDNEIATLFNSVPKYVASRGRPELAWARSTQLGPDLADAVHEIRDRHEHVKVVGSLNLHPGFI
jgi:hypothetical protein